MGNEFLAVAKSLEVKEIGKDTDSNLMDTTQNEFKDILTSNKNSLELDQKEDPIDVEEASQFDRSQNNQIKHEGIRYPCDKCNKSYAYKRDLLRHIRSFHDGVKFLCDLCDFESTRDTSLYKHKKNKH